MDILYTLIRTKLHILLEAVCLEYEQEFGEEIDIKENDIYNLFECMIYNNIFTLKDLEIRFRNNEIDVMFIK